MVAAVAAAVAAWQWRGLVAVAYVVCDKKDYLNNMVFTKNKANMEKLNAAKKKRDEVESVELVVGSVRLKSHCV